MRVRFAVVVLTEYRSPFCSVYSTPLATAKPSYPPDPILPIKVNTPVLRSTVPSGFSTPAAAVPSI